MVAMSRRSCVLGCWVSVCVAAFSIEVWRGDGRVEAADGAALPVVFFGFSSADVREDDGSSGSQEPRASFPVSAWLFPGQ